MFDSANIGRGGFELFYQDAGEGPALAFCHGFSDNHLSWFQQIPAFRGDYRCIVPDQRGFGRSEDTAEAGVGALAEDLVSLLDYLGIDRAALVGHSMGGWPVASVASQHPDRVSGLVLSASPGGLIDPDRHRELVAAADERPAVDPLTPELEFLNTSIDQLNRDAPEDWEATRAVLDGLPLDPDAVAADVPTFVIAGEADEFMPAGAVEAVADALDAESAIVDGAAHSVYYEQPEAFNQLVDDFLDSQAPW